MEISELKKLIKKLGGVLVMDGEEASFVMLSYENYNKIAKEEEAEVFVHNDLLINRAENGNESATADINADLAGILPKQEAVIINEIEAFEESDEDKIKRLNDEIALLKQEIKQKELEGTVDSLE